MVYRLLALNIDGTLLKENARISRETKQAIEYVKKKGVYITLVTSRPFPSAKKVAKALKLDSLLITNDGAFISSTAEDPIFSRTMKEEKALQIVDTLESFHCFIRVMDDKFAIGNKVRQKNNIIAKMMITNNDPPFYPTVYVDSVSEYLMEKPISPQKIRVTFDDPIEQKRAMEQMKKIEGIETIEKSSNQFDFVTTGVSKAIGLHVLGRYLGISMKEMVAVGSSEQDAEYVSQAGLGVAMGNSPRSLQEVADWITRSNEQNGVAYMVREVFRKQLRVQI